MTIVSSMTSFMMFAADFIFSVFTWCSGNAISRRFLAMTFLSRLLVMFFPVIALASEAVIFSRAILWKDPSGFVALSFTMPTHSWITEALRLEPLEQADLLGEVLAEAPDDVLRLFGVVVRIPLLLVLRDTEALRAALQVEDHIDAAAVHHLLLLQRATDEQHLHDGAVGREVDEPRVVRGSTGTELLAQGPLELLDPYVLGDDNLEGLQQVHGANLERDEGLGGLHEGQGALQHVRRLLREGRVEVDDGALVGEVEALAELVVALLHALLLELGLPATGAAAIVRLVVVIVALTWVLSGRWFDN